MNVTIDYLEVWQAPIGEQIRPRRFPVFAPHPKQWHAVVNFGALPQPSAALAAAPHLHPPQEPGVVTRRVPEIATRSHRRSASSHSCWHRYPTDRHANRSDRLVDRTRSRIPDPAYMRVRDRARVALDMWQVIHARGCRRAAKSNLWALGSEEPAHAPADRRGSDGRANTIYREPRRRRHEGAAECPRQNRGWKDAWQCPIEAGERLTISFCLLRLPFGHLRPPIPTAWCQQAVKPSSPKVAAGRTGDLTERAPVQADTQSN